MIIDEFLSIYKDDEHCQRQLIEQFLQATNDIIELKELRDFVENNVFGFGEREFYAMHKMIVDSINKKEIIFLEIGVFRGQILALYGILENLCNKNIRIIGISPLDSTDGHWESNYALDISIIHDRFYLKHPELIVGLSTDDNVIEKVRLIPLDILYIDGGHTFDVVISDIKNYSPLVVPGGYLVIDDSANNLKCCFNGKFWGISDVSNAVDSLLPPNTENHKWQYIGNIIHNRIWRRL
jgi:hypothetical protein